jgi:hypothetical protein
VFFLLATLIYCAAALLNDKRSGIIDFIIKRIDALFCGELPLILLLDDLVQILKGVILCQELSIDLFQLCFQY